MSRRASEGQLPACGSSLSSLSLSLGYLLLTLCLGRRLRGRRSNAEEEEGGKEEEGAQPDRTRSLSFSFPSLSLSLSFSPSSLLSLWVTLCLICCRFPCHQAQPSPPSPPTALHHTHAPPSLVSATSRSLSAPPSECRTMRAAPPMERRWSSSSASTWAIGEEQRLRETRPSQVLQSKFFACTHTQHTYAHTHTHERTRTHTHARTQKGHTCRSCSSNLFQS